MGRGATSRPSLRNTRQARNMCRSLVLGFDAAHTFHWKDRPLEVGLNIQNLTNLRYREDLNFFRYYADEPGLNLSLRAKLTFG